jgi:hypothetical protein
MSYNEDYSPAKLQGYFLNMCYLVTFHNTKNGKPPWMKMTQYNYFQSVQERTVIRSMNTLQYCEKK